MSSLSSLSPTPFGRLLTAMVTPFKNDGSVDFDLAASLANYLVDEGSDGIVVCGTTGESPPLTWQEQHQLLQEVRNAVGANVKILVPDIVILLNCSIIFNAQVIRLFCRKKKVWTDN